MEKQNDKTEIRGAVRIGNGTKLHAAQIDPRYGLRICCSCPGTQSGRAYHSARFIKDAQPNCGN